MPEPIRITVPPPIFKIRAEGTFKLDDEDRDRVEAYTAELVAGGKPFAAAEAEAVEQVAQDRLGSTGFVVEEAEPL